MLHCTLERIKDRKEGTCTRKEPELVRLLCNHSPDLLIDQLYDIWSRFTPEPCREKNKRSLGANPEALDPWTLAKKKGKSLTM